MKEESQDNNHILNKYLLIGWGVIAAILVITYAVEVLKQAFTPTYYLIFLGMTLCPFFFCIRAYFFDRYREELRYWIFAGYFMMYGYVLLTGHTNLVFTYIFPLMSLIILYHDANFILQVGATAFVLNIASIIRDYRLGKITILNSRDYEIQIALLLLCFSGCYMAAKVYDEISRRNKEKEQEVLKLQEERIILEERNRYALMDGLTELGNRRKYDECLDHLKENYVRPFYTVMIDINGLKQANDNIGHVAGDELIVGMAHCIRTSFDEECDEAFRFGGDEFAILSHSDPETFERKVKRLRENIALWKGVHVFRLAAAIGYCLVDDKSKIDAALHHADEQMYEDKKLFYAQSENDRRRK